jgi:ubiquinone/menaquinone biosynthesis C-methylase UbiE
MRMQVDFGRTAADYATHRAAYPDRLYDRLAAAGIVPRPGGIAAVDLATGTGLIARALARRGWAVTALDIAPAMIETAAALAKTEGVSIDARVAPAENTGCSAQSHDLVTAFCCWHWFDHDAAAREVHRILKPGGRLVVGALDFHRAPGNVIELSSALIKRHNPAWTPDRLGFRLSWADALPAAMFAIVERHDELIDVPYSQQAWCGRIRASAGVSASMAPEAVAIFDRAHARQLRQTYGEADLNVPHRLAYFIAQAR